MEQAKPIHIDAYQRGFQDQTAGRAVDMRACIEEHHQLIWKIVRAIMSRRAIPPTVEDTDLYSWGVEGLIKAKKRFDQDKDTSFSSYAYFRIKGEILDQLRKEWKQRSVGGYKEQKERVEKIIEGMVESVLSNDPGKVNIDSLLDMTSMVYLLSLDEPGNNGLSDNIADKTNSDSEKIEQAEEKDILDDMIDRLGEQEKEIIMLLYRKNKTQKEVAEYLKISRSTMCRFHNQILEKLKRYMDDEYS